MNTALMRFQDYTWKHNPKTIQVACRREIKEWKLPGQGNLLQDLGPGKRIVTGEGELFGEDCLLQFRTLAALCEQGGTGFLILPDSTGFEASLVSLTMVGQAGPDIVGYRFEFWEQVGEGIPILWEGKDYHIVQEGETLWDISKLYGISISELARRNPNVKRPDQLAAGEKVALR